jgi:hypothetical protein
LKSAANARDILASRIVSCLGINKGSP